MYGTRETFSYLACADCGCLQISNIPADLARYYPSDYYSYDAPEETPLLAAKAAVRRVLVFVARQSPTLRRAIRRRVYINDLLFLYRELALTGC
jgi:hypothetical protein